MKYYIAKTSSDNKEYKFDTLKNLRLFVRSVINNNEIRGIEETIEIYKESIKRQKIDIAVSKSKIIGTIDQLF